MMSRRNLESSLIFLFLLCVNTPFLSRNFFLINFRRLLHFCRGKKTVFNLRSFFNTSSIIDEPILELLFPYYLDENTQIGFFHFVIFFEHQNFLCSFWIITLHKMNFTCRIQKGKTLFSWALLHTNIISATILKLLDRVPLVVRRIILRYLREAVITKLF